MASTVVVQSAYEIAGEIASDAVKAMALAMGLTKSFDATLLEQIIALKAGELRHRLLRAIRLVQGPARFPQKNKNCSAGPPAELLCFDGHMEISSIGIPIPVQTQMRKKTPRFSPGSGGVRGI